MSREDLYHESGRKGPRRTNRNPFMEDNSLNGGLFQVQTEQDVHPVLFPIDNSSSVLTSRYLGLLFHTVFILLWVQFACSCV